jgi:multidrug efflux pump subunit AcrB
LVAVLAEAQPDVGQRVKKGMPLMSMDPVDLKLTEEAQAAGSGSGTGKAARQLQFLLVGQAITQVREDIRTVEIVGRISGTERLDPDKLENLTVSTGDGRPIHLSQIGRIEVRMKDPILKRRDRTPTITVRGDNDETTQPPDVSRQLWNDLSPIIAALPEACRPEVWGSTEEAEKAYSALAPKLS